MFGISACVCLNIVVYVFTPRIRALLYIAIFKSITTKGKKSTKLYISVTEEERDDPLFCLLWVILGSEGRWILSSIDDLNTRWLLQVQTQDLSTAKIARTLRVFFLFVLC